MMRKNGLESFSKNNLFSIFALDHALTVGNAGYVDCVGTVNRLVDDELITAVVVNPGRASIERERLLSPLFIQTMGMPSFVGDFDKTVLVSASRAVDLGASGISVQIDFQSRGFANQFALVAKQIEDAFAAKIPVLVMVNRMPVGQEYTDGYLNAARVLTEVGASLIKVPKVNMEGFDLEKFSAAVGSMAPILSAGGEVGQLPPRYLRRLVDSGFRGVCMGRNLFNYESGKSILSELWN